MKKLLMKPLKALASPGIYLFGKYNQYKRERQEFNESSSPTEDELFQLNIKIDKLLNKLNGKYAEEASSPDEECVICVNAKAVTQTYPCGHKVVCRRCFVKTIQIALSQRTLPLRCVICRAKILRLRQTPNNRLTTEPFCPVRSSFTPYTNKGLSKFDDNIWPGRSKHSKSLSGINGNRSRNRSSVSRSYPTAVYHRSSNPSRQSYRSHSSSTNPSIKNTRNTTNSTFQPPKSEIKEQSKNYVMNIEEDRPLEKGKQLSSARREELIHKFQRDFKEGQFTSHPILTRSPSYHNSPGYFSRMFK